jgi:hypothetical protein
MREKRKQKRYTKRPTITAGNIIDWVWFEINRKISKKKNWILTDVKHNDLQLLMPVKVNNFFMSEDDHHCIFYLRQKSKTYMQLKLFR